MTLTLRRTLTSIALVALVLGMFACVNRGGGRGGGGGGGSSDDDDAVDDDDAAPDGDDLLSAVRDVMEASGLFSLFGTHVDVEPGERGPGDCPDRTIRPGEVVLDYGEGCFATGFFNAPHSGVATITRDRGERTFTITFDDFRVLSAQLQGTITGSWERTLGPQGELTVTMVIDLDSPDEAAFEMTGELVVVHADGTAAANGSGAMTSTQYGPTEWTVTGILWEPAPREVDCYVPSAGEIRVESLLEDVDFEVVVTFTEESPESGAVIDAGGQELSLCPHAGALFRFQ